MNEVRQSVLIGRRRFFGSIAGFTASLIVWQFRHLSWDIPSGEPEFVIINGWVLTREDVVAREVTPDVI